MFCFLTLLTSSAVFGIDYGSEFIKVSMAQPGKSVHCVLNQQSKRLSPNYFAIWNQSSPKNTNNLNHFSLEDLKSLEWSFNDAAKSSYLRFPMNAISGLNILENQAGISGRECFALMISHLISTVDDKKWASHSSQVVLAVEPSLGIRERLAIVESFFLTNATLVSIVDSSTAVAVVYALEKSSFFAQKPKIVLFLDFGAKSTWVAIFNFSKVFVEQLSSSTNASLGGRLLNQRLMEFCARKYGSPETPRQMAVWLNEAEKAKERLTINTEAEVSLDDYVVRVTRADFEDSIKEIQVSLVALMEDALTKANLTVSDVDLLELLGGSSRVPFIQQVLKNFSGMEKLNKTLNADEAIALGAGYLAAASSSSFIVKKVDLAPLCNSNVSLDSEQIFNSSSTFKQRITRNITLPLSFSISVNNEIFSKFAFDGEQNATIEIGFDSFTLPTVLSAFDVNGTKIQFTKTTPWSVSADQIQSSQKFISQMALTLKKRHRLYETKNEFESFLYKTKSDLENEVVLKVSSEKERSSVQKIIEEQDKWFSENDDAPRKEFKAKLKIIRDAIKPIDNKRNEYVKRSPAFDKLNKTLLEVWKALKYTWPKEKPWLPEEKIQSTWGTYNSTLEWFEEKYREQSKMRDDEDPCVRVWEIEWKRQSLEHSYQSTNKTPRQTPTPAPKKPRRNLTATIESILNSSNGTKIYTPTAEDFEDFENAENVDNVETVDSKIAKLEQKFKESGIDDDIIKSEEAEENQKEDNDKEESEKQQQTTAAGPDL